MSLVAFLSALFYGSVIANSEVIISNVSCRYNVIIDAGSAGTRAFIYKYDADRPLETLTEYSSKKYHTGVNSKDYFSHDIFY
jgi:Golgi nucleoside diphosphatase